jgi:rod shape-determining protein MreC
MAPPQAGRHNYARRAQYGAFAGYVAALTGIIAGLLMALVWAVDPVGFGNLRLVVAEVVAPVGRAVNWTTGGVGNIPENVGNWWRAGSQNSELKAQVAAQRRDIIRARSLESENRELRRLLGIAQGEVRPIATASILSSTASSTRRYAIIDAGHSDGVRTGQPVRAADGLIGRTLEVGPSVARVLLITDRRSVVPARRASDGLALIVNGRGDDLLDVRTLQNAAVTLKVGDIVIASGSGGLYQPRTPIGRIVRVTRDGALAVAFVGPGSASAVIVEPPSVGEIIEPPITLDSNRTSEGGSAGSAQGE